MTTTDHRPVAGPDRRRPTPGTPARRLRRRAAAGRSRKLRRPGCAPAPCWSAACSRPRSWSWSLHGQSRRPRTPCSAGSSTDNGFALALLVLGFAAQWVLPLLTAIVAGDIFASEDQHGTWKTVLTRSTSRAPAVLGQDARRRSAFAVAGARRCSPPPRSSPACSSSATSR